MKICCSNCFIIFVLFSFSRFIVPKQDSAACGMSWEVIGVYHYHGKENDDGIVLFIPMLALLLF